MNSRRIKQRLALVALVLMGLGPAGGLWAEGLPAPIGDEAFGVLKAFYDYDTGMPLEARVVELTETETSVRRTFDLPVQSVVLLVPQGELSLQGVGLEPGGVIDTQTGPALSYTAGPLAAGEPLVFEIVAGSEPGAPAPVIGAPVNRRPQQETALGLLALALAVVSIYVIWRPAATPRPPVAAGPLLAQVATLDEQYEIGCVGEREYRRERRSLVRQIRALVLDDSDG